MPIRETLNASPVTLGEVFSNGKRYFVPPFQRDYAWSEAEWTDLWSDILSVVSGGDGAQHFLGALVLQPTDSGGPLSIIDGQQRLVTLSVLALAAIGAIDHLAVDAPERENNKERVRLLRERFVSTRDSASLLHKSRLELNVNDNSFYQTYLVQGATPPRPSALKGSERRLWECFKFFSDKLIAHLGTSADGSALARFLEQTVATRLRFIEIRVENDETAFSVFETLNARGVALGTTDLVKNYLFSQASRGGQSDLDQARLLWDRVVRAVPPEDVSSLLFHKLAGEVAELRERRVFVEVKRMLPEAAQQRRSSADPPRPDVFEFMRGLEASADLYAALDDPNDELWSATVPQARPWIGVLSTLGAEQYKSIALAAFDKLIDRPDKLARLFQILAILSVRASIAKVNTGDLQRAYQTTALKIGRGELKSPASIARNLANVTPSDDDFRSAFETLELDPKGRRKRFLRYLLSELEAASGGKRIQFDSDDVTIEHILPDQLSSGWTSFRADEHTRDRVRLGNLTPLELKLNRELGASPFERKREVYQQSSFALTRGIVAPEWTPDSLRARQAELARHAVRIWQISTDE